MATFPTIMRDCQHCTEGKGVCNGEVVDITTTSAREVFVRCAPIIMSGPSADQAQKFYDCLPRLLHEHGVKMSDVVSERVFFRDIRADFDSFAKSRREAYRQAGITGDLLPAISHIEQPPCRSEQAFEMQLYAIASHGDHEVRIHSFPTTEHGASVKLVVVGDYRHLHVMNVHGGTRDGALQIPFRQQSDTMFQRLVDVLQEHGTDFLKVLRTWCYLDEIDRDYDEFNTSRNAFFQQQHVERLPASTGIRSGLHPVGTLCAMDAYALLNPEGAEIEIMHTPTLNEAAEYGASFSRGMKLALPDKTILFISGTASVDEHGETVHLNDIRGQIERMLLNVQELLKAHGATFSDAAQVITYLKSREHLNQFLEAWGKWGLAGLPNSLVEAGVCRPDLLCELEAIAIVPRDR